MRTLTVTAEASVMSAVSLMSELLSLLQWQVLSSAQIVRIIQQAERVISKYIRASLISDQPTDKQTRQASSEGNIVITKILTMLYNLKVTELKAEAADRVSDQLRSQLIQKFNVLISELIKLKLTLWWIIVT